MAIVACVEFGSSIVVSESMIQGLRVFQEIVIFIVHIPIIEILYFLGCNGTRHPRVCHFLQFLTLVDGRMLIVDSLFIALSVVVHVLLVGMEVQGFLELVVVQSLIGVHVVDTWCSADLNSVNHALIDLGAQFLAMMLFY